MLRVGHQNVYQLYNKVPDLCVFLSRSAPIIIIMYIYHALINALSAHMIHSNLHMIFYTHVEHSPTKTIYIKCYYQNNLHKVLLKTHTHTHIDCSRNWVLILVRMEIL